MVSAHANDRKLAAKSVQDGSLRLYLCVMLHRQPLICEGGERGRIARAKSQAEG
jgi:DIS3-like exonuclease 2